MAARPVSPHTHRARLARWPRARLPARLDALPVKLVQDNQTLQG